MPSNSSESNEPTAGWWGDEAFRILLVAILSECHERLGDAIVALRNCDYAAYASAITAFSNVRRTSSEWLRDRS